jgi:uncharacterized membrane protein
MAGTTRTGRYDHPLQHRAFEIGIFFKALDGVLECIGGALIWFVTPALLGVIFHSLYGHEIFRVTGEQSGFHFQAASEKLASGSKLFPSLFLISHGITKIVLVVAIWMDELWAYPLMILIFGGFSVYQIYRLAHTHSLLLALLTLIDIAIVILTWREYQEQRRKRDEHG